MLADVVRAPLGRPGGRGRCCRARSAAPTTTGAGAPGEPGLELPEPIDEIPQRHQGLDGRDVDQRAVEDQPRLQRLAEVIAAPQHAVEHLRHARTVERLGLAEQLGELLVGRVDQAGARGGDLQHGEIAQVAHDRARELDLVDAALDRGLHRRERRARIPGGERPDERARQRAIGDAEDLRDVRLLDLLVTDERDDLIGQRQRITDAAARLAHEQADRAGLDGDGLAVEDRRQVLRQPRCGDELEVVALAARQDRVRQLVRLGGREHERHVRRRLLERLEQGVERLGREHVDFVDDVDLLAQDRGLVPHRLGQLADRVDAAVRGAVHLLVVGRAAVADRHARRAHAARLGRGALLAVERLANDPGERGLAAAARAAEQERVVDPAARERVPEGARDVLLPDDLCEGLGPVLASEDEVGHGPPFEGDYTRPGPDADPATRRDFWLAACAPAP